MKTLALAKNLNPPINMVTQAAACIGRRGSGKTYLANLIAERMLDLKAQVVILDPVGNWYGLRLDADGKRKGKNIFIIGGQHGDVPIAPDAGARIARLLVEKQISVILDISDFRQAERKRFAADFAEEFYHRKKTQKSAVHLFIEEAQLFAPQRCGLDEMRMLGAFESIVRLGRNYGIGATMISQRPQSINKEVLNQVECLFALQINGSQERKALESWVQEAGADRDLVGQLPGLRQGEGFVWSPSWLRIFAKFHFHKRTTFDASATPEVGKTKHAATLTPMNIAQLRDDLKTVIDAADADDPAKLRKQIAELKKQLGTPRNAALERHESAQIAALKTECAVLRKANAEVAVIIDKRNTELSRINVAASHAIKELEDVLLLTSRTRGKQQQPVKVTKTAPVALKLKPESEWPRPMPEGNAIRKAVGLPVITGNEAENPIGKAERSILIALAQNGPSMERSAVAAFSGYSMTTSSFKNGLSGLRTRGLIEGTNPIEITQAGRDALGDNWEPFPVGKALLDYWREKLDKAPGLILTVLAAENGNAINRSEVAERSGYSVTTSSFKNGLSALRTRKFIEGTNKIKLTADFARAIGAQS